MKKWKSKVLSDVSNVFEDGDWIESKDQSNEGVRLIQTGNVGNGFFKDRGEKARYISEATFSRLRCTEIFKGDCLISRLPDPVGRACIIPDTGEKMITAVDCTIIRFQQKEILPEWFLFYSLSNEYQQEIFKQVTGATRQRISRKNLGQIEIPLPSLPEQQHIVSILDEAFAAIAKVKSNAEQNLLNAKELFESYLQGVFDNGNWEKKKWGELCDFVRGPFGGSLKKNVFKESGYVVYEQKHAIHDHFNQLRYFIDEAKFSEMKRFEVLPGDIIMSCSGVTLGRVAVVPDGIPKGIINQALLKLTPKKNVTVHFIKHWLRSSIFQKIIFDYSGGAAIPNVPSAKILKDIKIPCPSLKEQERIVNEIEIVLNETKRLEGIYQQKISNLEELKKSILQKAFAGELKTEKEFAL
jgi:type I restriction enzyme, S subunit